jgi:excinuclease ABC subunit C
LKSSVLSEIPGIGEATQRKLMKKFGSVSAIKSASQQDISNLIGVTKAEIVKKYL